MGKHPLGQVDASSRLLPFAGLVALALTTLAIEPRPHGGAGVLAVLLLVIGVAAGARLPWRRWPSWIESVPAVAFLVPVGLLRDSTGGSVSGFAFLALLPVLWLALYGSWRQMLVCRWPPSPCCSWRRSSCSEPLTTRRSSGDGLCWLCWWPRCSASPCTAW